VTLDELLARECIHQTMVDYNMAGDRLRIEDFLTVFTDDAILETEGVPEADTFRYVGRTEIREWMERWTRGPSADQARPTQATFIRHHLSTSQIELTGSDSARARTYFTAYTDIGADHCGQYVDAYRKVGERWLIAHRRIRLDWRSPDSLYMTAVTTLRA